MEGHKPRWTITPLVGSTGRLQTMNCCLLNKIRIRHEIGCACRMKRLRPYISLNYCLKAEILKTVKVGVRGCVRDSRTHDAIRRIARVRFGFEKEKEIEIFFNMIGWDSAFGNGII